MKTLKYIIIASLFISPLLAAQQQKSRNGQQEVVVRIQQDEVGQKSVVQHANEWVDFGKNVGAAMDAGLSSLTRNANEFAHTDAGKFTMGVIAWKVAGADAMQFLNRIKLVVIGIPFLIVWTMFFIWFYRKNFMTYSVLATKEGPWWNSKKTYRLVNEEQRGGWSDGKCLGAAASGFVYAASTIAIAVNIIFN